MGQRTVLVVEDEPAIRSLLSLTLQAEDYDVATAEDGLDAISQVHEQQPDAILLDLLLPTLDGWEVIESLHRESQGDPIPIIAMSAGQRWPSVGHQGVTAFLSKPFEIDTLLVVLEDALRRDDAQGAALSP